jgi:DNA-binding NarL/FixJ family response regulator
METTSVLLVDDSSLFVRVATRFLMARGDIELAGTARDADEALRLAEELRPELVLLDLNMPHVSGLEVIPRLRRALPGVKIIVLTLWDTDLYRQAALAAGADDFVSKGQIGNNLLPAIRRLRASATAAP